MGKPLESIVGLSTSIIIARALLVTRASSIIVPVAADTISVTVSRGGIVGKEVTILVDVLECKWGQVPRFTISISKQS